MKRVVTILLAVMMLLSLLTVVPSAATGYTLAIPKDATAHNMETYGLHTMNVYYTNTAPNVNGEVSNAEYPGPNNGCSLSAVYGDNMFASSYSTASKHQNTWNPANDFTAAIAKQDYPTYINSYLTYDDENFYFAVTSLLPEVRVTTASDNTIVTGSTTIRDGLWDFTVRFNFLQSDNIAANNSGSFVENTYTLLKDATQTTAQKVALRRTLTVQSGTKFVTSNYSNYTDDIGQVWNGTVYKRDENFSYKVSVQNDGKWGVTFEGKMPLADVLRVTDVEFDDGTPIDYVPEWGQWGVKIRLQASRGSSVLLGNGSNLMVYPDDTFFVQTFLPAAGSGNTGKNSMIGEYVFSNTISAAVKTAHGQDVDYLMNPVRFLGEYNPNLDYEGIYPDPSETVVKTTVRRTRDRGAALTSGVRGVNNRVVGVATHAAGATGDSITLTVVLAVVMLLLAAVAVCVIIMKKRSPRTSR